LYLLINNCIGIEMIGLEQYLPSERDAWTWRLARLSDVPTIVAMAQQHFQLEMEQIIRPDPALFARNIGIAVITQMHSATQEQVLVARDRTQDELVAWSWISRGSYTTYSRDEMAEARFVHCDMTQSVRARLTQTAQVLQQWYLWCMTAGVPVLVSSSIRADQVAFMRLHEAAGFSVRGSIAYIRVTE
jgi:hypothetical protein